MHFHMNGFAQTRFVTEAEVNYELAQGAFDLLPGLTRIGGHNNCQRGGRPQRVGRRVGTS